MKKLLIICIIAFSLFSCKKDKDGSCGTNHGAQTIVHDGLNREYMLYVPSSYNDSIPTPVLMNFHGFGGNATDYMNETNMSFIAESDTFILVYPQGTCLDGFSHWNAALPGPDNKSDADDFGFIEALIHELSSDYNIDPGRIYACGYSNGAMFAYGLACHESDIIAAVGSVSGTMLDTDCTTSHPMPVIIIHGTSDGVLPYNGSSDYNSVETVLNYWISFNSTSTIPVFNSVNDHGTTIEHYQYNQGDNDVSVEHYKIIDGEHVWFNINYQGAGTGNIIWDFVSGYDINGLR